MHGLTALLAAAVTATGAPASAPCTEANATHACFGSACEQGVCVCDKGFTGHACSVLDLGNCTAALNPNNTWTWGAAARWVDPGNSAGGVEIMTMGLRERCGINEYRSNAHIIRAAAPSILGPYTLDADGGTVGGLGPTEPPHWDATETEDPNVVNFRNGSALLFYTGAYVENQTAKDCTNANQPEPASNALAAAQRIGVAYRDTPGGPWVRVAAPVLTPRKGAWDSVRVSNPAALIFENGTVLLAYRGNGARAGGIGIARAEHWTGPYIHVLDHGPLFDGYAEDPTLFLGNRGVIHMIAHGELGGALAGYVGIHAVSTDGVNWDTFGGAYTLAAVWSPGTAGEGGKPPRLGRREAPQVLMDGTTPVALFNGAMPCDCHYGNRAVQCNWGNACRSFSMVCSINS